MAISDSTLFTDVWSEIRSIIVGATPYITNSSTSATALASVEAAYNDKFLTRPQVIIPPIEKGSSDYKFGENLGKRLINVIVECYGTKSLYSDQLIQQVDFALASTVPTELELIGTVSNGSFESIGSDPKSKLFGQSMTFTYTKE